MARADGVDRGIFEQPKGSGKWYACWAGPDGKVNRKSIGTKAQARAYVERKRQETKQAKLFPELVREKQLTVVDALDRYQSEWARKLSSHDDERYARYWRAELGQLKLSQVTPGHIETWRSKRLAEVKGATVNRAVSFLRRLFNLAIRDGLTTKNPASSRLVPKLKEQRRIQYLSEEEEYLLLRACYPRLRAAVELAILTGMRAGEQFGMRQEDVRGDSIVLPRTKSGKTRYLPIPARAQSILAEQLATPGEWVWPGKNPQEPCDSCAMNRSLRRACERAGIRVVSWHALRHTFGTRAVQRSDIRTVCEAMGHSSISVTEIYLQVIGSRLDALMREQKLVNSGEVLVKLLTKNMKKYARNRFDTPMECTKNMTQNKKETL